MMWNIKESLWMFMTFVITCHLVNFMILIELTDWMTDIYIYDSEMCYSKKTVWLELVV